MENGQCLSRGFSGGLEETYTDFDAWLTRRSWMHRHRPYHKPSEEVHPNRKPSVISLQDSLVNGFEKKYNLTPERDLYSLRRFCRQNENWTHLDFVMLRLMNGNGRRSILLVNKSKL